MLRKLAFGALATASVAVMSASPASATFWGPGYGHGYYGYGHHSGYYGGPVVRFGFGPSYGYRYGYPYYRSGYRHVYRGWRHRHAHRWHGRR